MSRREDALLRLSGLAEEANAMGYDEAGNVIRDMVQVIIEEEDSPAAGPWHRWPEERPGDAGRLYLVAWQIAQPSVMVWGGEGSWEGYSITHWAEVLPPREER